MSKWFDGLVQEIISEEIVDETDMYESNRIKQRALRQSTSVVMRGYARFLLPIARQLIILYLVLLSIGAD